MKKEVGPGVIAVVAVVVLIIIGAWAWKNFAPPTAKAGSNPYQAGNAPKMERGAPPPGSYMDRGAGPGGPGGAPYPGGPGGPPGGQPYGQPPGPR